MTSDVVLRDVIESDLPVFFEQQLDEQATHMASFPARNREAFMKHWAKIMGEKTAIQKTITVGDNVAGYIGSWEQAGERKVGYWLGKEYWGKGIATAALSQFLGQEKVRPMYAHVAKQNIGSIRVLQKCGFTISREDNFLDADGKEFEELILKLEKDDQIKVE
ncbi:MAG TPA: GNAT family N-acetyltransferase [Pyrinomonadaceae bacterium]|nr:GNAT family N-acetyltransferase [Pyrinomonadaceae bacterium]